VALINLHAAASAAAGSAAVPEDAIRRGSNALLQALLTNGSLERTRSVLNHFLQRPQLRELANLDSEACTAASNLPAVWRSKHQQACDLVIQSIQEWVRMFNTGSGAGGGARASENANAMRALVTGIVSKNLFEKNELGRAMTRLTGISYRQLRHAADARKRLEDEEAAWQRVTKAEYRSSIK